VKLDDIVPQATIVPPEAASVEIAGLAYDNRRVGPGTLFFCVRGFTSDGHDFAPDAVARGAAALVVERPLGLGVPEVRVASVRDAMAGAAARFHGDPSAALKIIGITGTNGKTTTAFIVRALLEAAGHRCALLGTVTSIIGGQAREVQRTTPEAIELQASFREMIEAGDEYCAMEVSSHALELGRADAIHFAAAVFTNLTQDHLDFHPTMEDYFVAKRRLFDGDGAHVVNVDDPYGRRLAAELEDPITFAIDAPAQYQAREVHSTFAGCDFVLRTTR
jgi:UDP-N-acetylmuramoyl-L-alanyl-D-glutamate--2,6-diaminopimelate ligase